MKTFLKSLTTKIINKIQQDNITVFLRIVLTSYLMKYTDESFNDLGYNNLNDNEKNILKDLEEDFNTLRELDPLCIGWMYQYYQMSFKSNSKNIKEEDIAKETQTFTPDWISSYLLSNTLGKIWLDNTEMNNDFPYYIKSEKKNIINNFDLKKIKIFDPCMGCGHILCKAYDMLFDMYKQIGYDNKDIPVIIIENNLYGIDIDEVACKITVFILLLKSIRFDKEILTKKIKLNINYFKKEDNDCCILANSFKNVKTFGSITYINHIDLNKIICSKNCAYKTQYNVLNDKYDIVVTNPPYLGRKGLNKDMKEYFRKHYPNAKSELYSAFIIKCLDFLKEDGLLGMITIHTFMFISSFKELRNYLLDKKSIISMVHTGACTFDDLNGFNVLSTAFILGKKEDNKTTIVRLTHIYDSKQKEKEFYNKSNYYYINQDEFKEIPNTAYIYWLDKKIINLFYNYPRLGDLFTIRAGMQTSNNEYYLRYWYEVPYTNISFNAHDKEEHFQSKRLFVPYNKGGDYRKWYGNNEIVIKFDEEHYNKLAITGNHLPSRKYYFKEGITWGLFGFENFGVRYKENGFVFDISGSSMFLDDIYYMLGLLCSNVAYFFLSTLNPTVNYQVGNIKDIPYIECSTDDKKEIEKLVKNNIIISKNDWDLLERSWDYKESPLIKYNCAYIEDALEKYHLELKRNYDTLVLNEKKLNQIFSKVYGLYYDNSIKANDITLQRENKEKEIKDFISYVIGVILGRYKISGYKSNIVICLDEIMKEFKIVLNILFSGEVNINISYIDKILPNKKTIESYITKDFFNYQLKTFNDLPIYWLFEKDNKQYMFWFMNIKNISINGLFNKIFIDEIDLNDGIKINYQKFKHYLTNIY